jgi:regulator of protease activity HflC (stomatin/prohibitin superfamily)
VIRWFRVRENERALVFRHGAFLGTLPPGRHLRFDPLWRERIDVVSVREPWLRHPCLDVIVRSGRLGDEAIVLDLADHERALVWVDGRLDAVLRPGISVLWTVFHAVRVQVVDARTLALASPEIQVVLAARGADDALESVSVEAGHVALFFKEGRHEATLGPGTHAWWTGVARTRAVIVDLREQVLDVVGQDIMTADKVTLRLNAVLAYRVADPVKAVTAVEDFRQALYRETQLALRGVIGTRELDLLLSDREALARELDGVLRARVGPFGVEVISLGIRDVILPGEMKDLLNKVTQAKKAAEANLITRREEVAAMRSQANTARILESSPTLMRLREMETLERVADKGHLKVVVGEKGLTDRVMKLV